LTYHALLHLGGQARYFGSLRNLSVATKEMVHRLYKSVIPSTNRQNPQRDLTVFENAAQGIRFALEADSHDSATGGLKTLQGLGFFDNVYFESGTDLLARLGCEDDEDEDFSNAGRQVWLCYL
jgi:hypothetical protein